MILISKAPFKYFCTLKRAVGLLLDMGSGPYFGKKNIYLYFRFMCIYIFIFHTYIFIDKYDLQWGNENLFTFVLNPVFPTGKQKLFLELLLLAYSYIIIYYISYPLKWFFRFSALHSVVLRLSG